MKRRIIIFCISIILIIQFSCFSKENELIIVINRNIIKIDNKYTIDLNKNDKEILLNYGKYDQNEFPFGIFYNSKEYPIQLVYENNSNKISKFVLYYDLGEFKKYKYIRIRVNELTINTNTSYDEIINILDKNKIKYNIDKTKSDHIIEPQDYYIYSFWYSNESLSSPSKIRINLDKL